MKSEYILRMENINKSFFGVTVLKDVSLKIRTGEVHALVGENGAGKSTLMKILAGIHGFDSGSIYFNDKEITISSPVAARNFGITMMHQEISMVPQLTIAENIYLGQEKLDGMRLLDKKRMMKNVQVILDELNLKLKANTIVEKLSIAQQQMVEIAKALSCDSKIIIMDEPTAALTEPEVASLINEIKKLRQQGVAIIFVSHRMEEIFEISDRVTVLRDSEFVATETIDNVTRHSLVGLMVGREIKDIYGTEKRLRGGEEFVLEVKNLTNNYLKGVSFNLKKGEILGFAGLMGAGRTEVVKVLFGVDSPDSGEIYLNGKHIQITSPNMAIKYGMSMVPEDRKNAGLVQSNTVAFNLTLSVLNNFMSNLRIDKKKENSIINEYANKLSIKMTSTKQLCRNLSGGNQQKVVISKCLASKPNIIIMDEPTRGIDVGAKSEIYQLIRDLAESGISIIFISSELPEIINLSSRIVVMYEGNLMAVFNEEDMREITQEKVMHYATGGSINE